MSLKTIALATLLSTGASEAPRPQDTVASYMQSVQRHELLDAEDEVALGTRVQETGDQTAVDALVRGNLRLVVKIAHRYRKSGLPLEDLVQEGNLGLLDAAWKYDPSKGTRFSTYAGYWIRAHILRLIMDNKRLVRVGRTQDQRKLFYNLSKIESAIKAAGDEPTAARIAAELGVKEKAVVEMQIRMGAPEASLDAPVDAPSGEGTMSLGDFQASAYGDAAQALEDHEDQGDFREKLDSFASGLEGREKEVFEDRLLAEDPATLQDLGDRWGVSRERARQIESRLLGKLRAHVGVS